MTKSKLQVPGALLLIFLTTTDVTVSTAAELTATTAALYTDTRTSHSDAMSPPPPSGTTDIMAPSPPPSGTTDVMPPRPPLGTTDVRPPSTPPSGTTDVINATPLTEKKLYDLETSTTPPGVSNYSQDVSTTQSGVGVANIPATLKATGVGNTTESITGVEKNATAATVTTPTQWTPTRQPDIVATDTVANNQQHLSITTSGNTIHVNHVTNHSQNVTNVLTESLSSTTAEFLFHPNSSKTWTSKNISDDNILSTTLGTLTSSNLNDSDVDALSSTHPLTVGSIDEPSFNWTLSVTYVLAVTLLLGLLALLVVLVLAAKRCLEGHRKRTYSRLAGDLVNGIYST